MAKTLRPLILLAVLLLPVTPFLASTDRQNHKEIHVIDGRVYWDVDAGIELGVWEAIGVLQEALERRAPAWAQYRWQDSRGREHSLAEYIWDVADTQMIGVNPRVLLVTAGMALDWQVPKGKDLPRAISEVGVTLTQHERAFSFDEALRARYPQVANAGSYALYAFFGYDREKLHAWRQTYEELFGRGALILAATPTPNATPRPFMARPFAQPPAPTPFYTIYSFLDHNAPYIYDEPTLTRFDGLVLDTQGGCVGGKSCYSGHEGLDYTTGRDYPAVQPPVYAVGDGVVTRIITSCGQVEVLHEDEQVVSVYMHMENIQVARNQRVDTDTLLGYTGNVANGVNCRSTGPHLHFHTRFQHDRRAFLEPFGWWDAAGDPDPLEDYREDGWSGSWWLWRGDEAGDGYLVVDNRESQAQLFYPHYDERGQQTWWYDAAGYGNASWWTYSVTDENDSTNWGIWGAQIETSGLYCLSAYWPRRPQNTTTAQYRIFSQAQGLLPPAVVVNQREQGDTWVPLGEYALARGPSVVILTDFVGPNGTAQERVYFDAVKWAPGPCATPTATPTVTATPPPPPTATPTPTATPAPSGFFLTGPYQFTISLPGGQQYGNHVLSFTQPDGAAFAGIVVYTDYWRTMFRDAASLGLNPSLHGGSSPWDHGAGWYCRTSGWGEDAGACDFAAAALGQAFLTPRPLSYWNRNGWPGSLVYSALGVESYPCCEWPPVTANLTVYYIWNGVPPTPTPTPTPTCPCPFICGRTVSSNQPALPRLFRAASQVADLTEFAPLLYQVRDNLMAQSQEGRRYIGLFNQHSAEIASILLSDDALYDQAYATMKMFEPGLRALAEGRGEEVTITAEQVQAAQAFLDALLPKASAALQEAIRAERARRPLEDMVGMTMKEAWNHVNR